MTAKPLLTALLPLVSDLSRDLPEGERYRRLLKAMRALLPCDAAALLRLDGEWLVPLAVDGGYCWAYEITLLRTAATSMHYWMSIFVRPKSAWKRCCN